MIKNTKNKRLHANTRQIFLHTSRPFLLFGCFILCAALTSQQASAKTAEQSVILATENQATEGQATESQTTKSQANLCFDNIDIEANFIAFTTAKDSALARWYQTTFNLNTVKSFAFPNGKVTGVLMNRDDFIVEVFFRSDLLVPKKVQPESSSEQWQGFNKVGIFTNADLPILKQCLINSGVKAGRIWHDKNLPISLLQVIDPDGNVLEIINRIK